MNDFSITVTSITLYLCWELWILIIETIQIIHFWNKKPKHDSIKHYFNEAEFSAINQSVLTQYTQAVHDAVKLVKTTKTILIIGDFQFLQLNPTYDTFF